VPWCPKWKRNSTDDHATDELCRARDLFLILTFYEAFEHAVVFRHVKRSDVAPSLEESLPSNKICFLGNFISVLALSYS
jgi:hypothetical protein